MKANISWTKIIVYESQHFRHINMIEYERQHISLTKNWVWKPTLNDLKNCVWNTLTLNNKTDWVWRQIFMKLSMKANTLNLEMIEYESQHFKNYKLLSMKANIYWTKNNCVWKSTLQDSKIIDYEVQHLHELWVKSTLYMLKMIEYEGTMISWTKNNCLWNPTI